MLRFTAVTAIVGSLLASSALSAEVVETSADGFVTRDRAEVSASVVETWLALTKPGDWWNDAHTWSADASNMTLTPQAGGCFCERVPGEDREDGFSLDGSVQHAVVVQAYPLRVLRMRGGLGPLQGEPATGILTITLEEIDSGTRIVWEYNVGGPMRYDIPQISAAVDGVMTQQLHGLRDHLGMTNSSSEVGGVPSPTEREELNVEAEIDQIGREEQRSGPEQVRLARASKR